MEVITAAIAAPVVAFLLASQLAIWQRLARLEGKVDMAINMRSSSPIEPWIRTDQ